MNSTALQLYTDTFQDHYQCDITETYTMIESGVCVKTYGLHLYNKNPFLAQKDGESCCIEDVSPSYQETAALKQLIEEMEVYPVHLLNVIEDYFS